jgi:hypothetical protein
MAVFRAPWRAPEIVVLRREALNAGVDTPEASGPIASARVVSIVMSKIDGLGWAVLPGPPGDVRSAPQAATATEAAMIVRRRKDVGVSTLTT